MLILRFAKIMGGLVVIVIAACVVAYWYAVPAAPRRAGATSPPLGPYRPRKEVDISGFSDVLAALKPWPPDAALEEIAGAWRRVGYRRIEEIDRQLAAPGGSQAQRIGLRISKAALFNYEGEPDTAYQILAQIRAEVEADERLARLLLPTLMALQGMTALRIGENDNCILCRGESSCILPIAPAAIHTNPRGSRLAIRHFTEYLDRFPDDLEIRWLLNLAHMTLGEYPSQVDRRYRITLDRFRDSEFKIGKFRDIGHLVGVNRLNQAGGAILDDFDNDGWLDLVVTTMDPTRPMAFYHNQGNGTFADRTESAGLSDQLGGLYCVQADYNNDGYVDIFITRGAWLFLPMRPSLLRNNGDGTFSDVTRAAGLLDPVNAHTAGWADYDNDGWLDLFVGGEQQPNRLYHNRGDGTFEEVAARAGVPGGGRMALCKGSAWIDFDNDDDPDLFLDYLSGPAHLHRNNGDGTFTDVTQAMGINGPEQGFSCWAWDYDNDGWLDLFATSFDHSLQDIIKGLLGQPHRRHTSKLYRNRAGRGFDDMTRAAGLDLVFATMGSNYADFDNDGFLDMYLGTGDPGIATLVPNRMFKNVAGQRFAEITGPAGTGHLQKGHGVACGDWDRDGDVDLFIEMGGTFPGDQYHNILFQNPGQGHHWLTVKLIGAKSNRSAIGARLKLVTAGDDPATIHRHVSSGSSFGANPLEQTIGLGHAQRIATLEIHWPTSRATQVFHDLAVDQAIEITEFADHYRVLDWKRIPAPH